MIKQVKCVKVCWNDRTGMRPSYYPDTAKAIAAIDNVVNFGGVHGSAFAITMKEETRLLNMDNSFDAKWYAKFIRLTCRDAEKPHAVEARESRAAAAVADKTFNFSQTRNCSSGFENTFNPKRQAAGAAGGIAGLGVKHASFGDKRHKGTVNVNAMDVVQKRSYWRWCKMRQRMNKAGSKPVSWEEWKRFGN